MNHNEVPRTDPIAPTSATWGVVAVALVLPSLVTWLYFVALAERDPAVQQIAYGGGKLVQFVLPVVWVFLVLRQRIHLPKAQGVDALWGAVTGGVVVAAMFALYLAALKPWGLIEPAVGAMQSKVLGMGIDSFWKYAALGTFYALVHSLLEEYYWRWFVFGQLRTVTSFWPAAIVSSLGFMAHHVILLGTYFGYASPLTWLFSASIAVGGMLWAWMYERSGVLYGAWLSHLLVDAGIFLLGWQLVHEAIVR